jgi:hypothetical protein
MLWYFILFYYFIFFIHLFFLFYFDDFWKGTKKESPCLTIEYAKGLGSTEFVLFNNFVWNNEISLSDSYYFYGDVENDDDYSTLKSSTEGLKFHTGSSNIYVFDIKFEISGNYDNDSFYISSEKTLQITHC